MRTASMVLGIVGGILAIILGIVALVIAGTADIFILEDSYGNYMDDFNDALEKFSDGNYDFDFEYDFNYSYEWDVATQAARGYVTYLYIAGSLGMIGGILGIIGGAIVKKKNVLAGVFMIIACVLSSLSVWGLFGSVPLLVGGILALIKDKRAQYAAAGYPYPPYQPNPYEQDGAYNPYAQQVPPQYNPYQPAPPQYNPYQQAPPPPNAYQQAPPQEPPAPQAPPASPQEDNEEPKQ
jgi:hypothetical protein